MHRGFMALFLLHCGHEQTTSLLTNLDYNSPNASSMYIALHTPNNSF